MTTDPDGKEMSIHDLLSKAEEERKNKNDQAAIELYGQVLNNDSLQIAAYDGLMKLYRKAKDYKKELKIIETAIKAYQKYYNDFAGKHSKKVKVISEKLNKSFGLVDKKGTQIYSPAPIGRWEIRKQVVKKRLAKK